jgi:mono/diheme cytochrome c family protein
MKTAIIAAALAATFVSAAASAADPAAGVKRADIERGRYLVKTSGCNDCHTPGYMPRAGQVDEKLWLTGDALGWRGPWGTTYPANLRLYVAGMSEDAWVARTRKGETRPPMPWFNLHAMTEQDLRAIYRYTRALGPAGQPAPAYVPAGEEPTTPFLLLEPQLPKAARVSAQR